MWPQDLNKVKRRGDLTITEIWFLKERMDAGVLNVVKRPERCHGDKGQYYTVYGAKDFETYVILTEGNPESGEEWCIIIAVNKITAEQASRLLSCYPYE